MKFIKQTSTNKIVYRESPHTDKTLANAVMDTNIPESDLEVAEENWTDDEWTVAMNNQLPYSDRRKSEYPTIEELVVALYDPEDKAEIDRRRAEVKSKYPKGAN